jgi:hypothetical protein
LLTRHANPAGWPLRAADAGASDSFLRGYVFTRWEFATLQKPPYTDAENESNNWFRQIARDDGTEWEQEDEVVDEENNACVAKRLITTQPLDTAAS